MKTCLAAACLVAASAPAQADEAAFVEANLLSIFYHELGHAMIDLLGLPVFGQEEDAADVASILMIHDFYEEDAAQALAYDAAFGFAAEGLLREAEGHAPAWWGVHGPDEQRFYNTVCLFYGGNPNLREDFARDMELPEDRAESCQEEFWLAWDSWGSAFDELAEMNGDPLQFDGGTGALADLIRDEVAWLNDAHRWPAPLRVTVDDCGEANAFYDPETIEVVMCAEFVPHLRDLYRLIAN